MCGAGILLSAGTKQVIDVPVRCAVSSLSAPVAPPTPLSQSRYGRESPGVRAQASIELRIEPGGHARRIIARQQASAVCNGAAPLPELP